MVGSALSKEAFLIGDLFVGLYGLLTLFTVSVMVWCLLSRLCKKVPPVGIWAKLLVVSSCAFFLTGLMIHSPTPILTDLYPLLWVMFSGIYIISLSAFVVFKADMNEILFWKNIKIDKSIALVSFLFLNLFFLGFGVLEALPVQTLGYA